MLLSIYFKYNFRATLTDYLLEFFETGLNMARATGVMGVDGFSGLFGVLQACNLLIENITNRSIGYDLLEH